MIVVPHQPEHLPWMGFIAKAVSGDCLCFLDNVQFRKNYFQNRNKIRAQDQAKDYQWIGLPVKRTGLETPIFRIEIDANLRSREKCWKTIHQTYSNTKFFNSYSQDLESLYLDSPSEKLADFNIAFITFILRSLHYDLEMKRATDFPEVNGKKTEMLVKLCASTKADKILLGPSAKEYIDLGLLVGRNIDVLYFDSYKAMEFLKEKNMNPSFSIIDFLLTLGPDETRKLVEAMKYVHLKEER